MTGKEKLLIVTEFVSNLYYYASLMGWQYCDDIIASDDGTGWTATGDEHWRYGGHEKHYYSFPDVILTMSKEEIKEYVYKETAEREARLQAEEDKKRLAIALLKEQKALAKEEKDRLDYLRLKEKYKEK